MLIALFPFIACSGDPDCFDRLIEDHRTKDFNYLCYIGRTFEDGRLVIDTISIAKAGERVAWVSPEVISVSSDRWSYGAFRGPGIALYQFSQGRSSYFYAPQDFVSVLEFACDSARSIDCRSVCNCNETEVFIFLRDNALGIDNVRLLLEANGPPKSMVVNYVGRPSPFSVTYTIEEEVPMKNNARPYCWLIDEENGQLVARGSLAGFKLINEP